MKQPYKLHGVYSMIANVGKSAYAVLSISDFGYDGNTASVYEVDIIQLTVAIRKGIKDYYITVNAGGRCINIWSEDIPSKIFFSEKDANKQLMS